MSFNSRFVIANSYDNDRDDDDAVDSGCALALDQCMCVSVCVCVRVSFYFYDYYCSFENYISSFISCGAIFLGYFMFSETGNGEFLLSSNRLQLPEQSRWLLCLEKNNMFGTDAYRLECGRSLAANTFCSERNYLAIFTPFHVVGSVAIGRPLYQFYLSNYLCKSFANDVVGCVDVALHAERGYAFSTFDSPLEWMDALECNFIFAILCSSLTHSLMLVFSVCVSFVRRL